MRLASEVCLGLSYAPVVHGAILPPPSFPLLFCASLFIVIRKDASLCTDITIQKGPPHTLRARRLHTEATTYRHHHPTYLLRDMWSKEKQPKKKTRPARCHRCRRCKGCRVHFLFCVARGGRRHNPATAELRACYHPEASFACRFEVGPTRLSQHLLHIDWSDVFDTLGRAESRANNIDVIRVDPKAKKPKSWIDPAVAHWRSAEDGVQEAQGQGQDSKHFRPLDPLLPRPMAGTDLFQHLFFCLRDLRLYRQVHNNLRPDDSRQIKYVTLQEKALRGVAALTRATWELLTFPNATHPRSTDSGFIADDHAWMYYDFVVQLLPVTATSPPYAVYLPRGTFEAYYRDRVCTRGLGFPACYEMVERYAKIPGRGPLDTLEECVTARTYRCAAILFALLADHFLRFSIGGGRYQLRLPMWEGSCSP